MSHVWRMTRADSWRTFRGIQRVVNPGTERLEKDSDVSMFSKEISDWRGCGIPRPGTMNQSGVYCIRGVQGMKNALLNTYVGQ